MEENLRSELHLKINQILARFNFYHLPLIRLIAILRLLGEEEARQAKAIQANTISGIIKLTTTERQKKPTYFQHIEKTPQISEVQVYLSGIIRTVIDERYSSGSSPMEETEGKQAVSFPSFNPFNCMGFNPSSTFPPNTALSGRPLIPPSTLTYPNTYLPYNNYNNPEMYYYRMYGGFPPLNQTNPPQVEPNLTTPRQQMNRTIDEIKESYPQRQSSKMNAQESQENKAWRELKKSEEQFQEKRQTQKGQINPQKPQQSVPLIKKSKRLEKLRQKQQKHSKSKYPFEFLAQRRNQILEKIFSPKNIEQPNHSKQEQNQRKKIFERSEQHSKISPEKPQKSERPEQSLTLFKQQKQQKPFPEKTEQVRRSKKVQRSKKRAPHQILKLDEQEELAINENKQPDPLELKYYNSISDFDYRTFPPPPIAISVQTQTDFNFIINDFRVIDKNMHQQPHQLPEQAKIWERSKLNERSLLQSHQKYHRQQINDLSVDDVNSSCLRGEKQANHMLEIVSSEIKMEEQEHFGMEEIENHHHTLNLPLEQSHREEQMLEEPQNHPIQQENQPANPEQSPQHPENSHLPQEISPPNQEPPQAENPYLVQQSQANNCACGGAVKCAEVSCITCQERYHFSCLRLEPVEKFICPRCRMRKYDPFFEVRHVCGESFMQNLAKGQFRVRVNVEELEYLLNRRGQEAMEQIQLRCLWVDSGEEVDEMTWPDEAEVRVNGAKVTEFYRSLALRRRRDTPLIITQAAFKINSYDIEEYGVTQVAIALRKTPNHQSSALIPPKVQEKNEAPSRRLQSNKEGLFLLGIYHTRKYPIASLFLQISETLPSCGLQFVQGLLVEHEGVGLDCEVLRLHDPFSGSLMQVPVRGANCRHGQCFDLRTYLALMSALKHRPWRCPICGRQAKKFIVDNWVLDLIQRSTSSNSIPSQVIVRNQGNIVLRMGLPSDLQQESSYQQKAKNKRIKKRPRAIVKRENNEDPIRTFDIDKYLTDQLQDNQIERRPERKK